MLAAFYPTKKALKESKGQQLKYGETSIMGPEYKSNGRLVVVGPSSLERKWYATVTLQNGFIVKVS